MEELQKMIRARAYMQALAQGTDPISGLEIPGDDVANQVRLRRCFAYVASVLDQVIQNGGKVGGSAKIVARTGLTEEQKRAVHLSERPIGITELAKRILAAAEVDRMRGVSGVHMAAWLLEKGFLEEEFDDEGELQRVPSQAGAALGITKIMRETTYGVKPMNLYSIEAQRFILDNLDEILCWKKQGRK